MRGDLLNRRRAQRFARLLDDTDGRGRHHTHVRDEQLTKLVNVGRALTRARPSVHLDDEVRGSLRAMLLATAERDGIGVTATGENSGAHAAVREPRRGGLLGVGSGRRFRARGAIAIGVTAGALAVSGMSAASESAVPGDALYTVKRSTEFAQRALTSGLTEGQLLLDFAQTRLAEAGAMDLDGRGFASVLNDMDADTIDGVKLMTTSAVRRRSVAPLNAIDAFIDGQRDRIGPLVDRLDAVNRDRALRSLTLLEEVDRRVRALRNNMGCESDGADKLGPKLKPCTETASIDEPTVTGERQDDAPDGRPAGRPEKQDPTVAPSPSDAGPSGLDPGRTAPDVPAPAVPSAGTGGLLDKIVDGLLG